MEIRNDILLKHYEKAAIEQIKLDYEKKGYTVKVPRKDFGGDLIAQRGSERIIFEIKIGKWEKSKQESVVNLKTRIANKKGAKFRIVFVNIPKESDIEIIGLDVLLWDELIERFNNEFDRVATHYSPSGISEILYDSLAVDKDFIDVSGSGLFEIDFQYGSDGDVKKDEGVTFSDSFPFLFSVRLNHKLEIVKTKELELLE